VTEADLYTRLSTPRPPPHAPRYRRWRVWFDPGHYEHGIIYRETAWRGESPSGEQIETPKPAPGEKPVEGFAWIRAHIDRVEDARLEQRRKKRPPAVQKP
jgi:hypothetical protein